jgi:hypothetical protein
MSSITEFDASSTGVNEKPMECKPLLDAATKDLFRRNAFRVTRLPVDATSRDVAKRAEKLKVFAELGQDPHPNAAFPLRPSPTVEDIRQAIQNLKDPEKRLVDEFFWFWPESFGQSRSDPAIQALEKGDLDSAAEIWMSKRKDPIEGAVATHNLALIYHISALDWENLCLGREIDAKRREEVTEYWKAALYRWGRAATNERFWEKLAARIGQLNEPNLTTGFAKRMRVTLPAALAKINAELAIELAESGKVELALLHIQLMREISGGQAQAEKIPELVLAPARKRVSEQILRARSGAAKDPRDAVTAARELLKGARKTLALVDLFFDEDSSFRNDVFDEVAEACNQLVLTYHKATNDNETCLEFLKIVLPFAVSQELREQIEKGIRTLAENIETIHRDKKFYGNLRPISSAPTLGTILYGIGFTLYGSTDVDETNGSYLATYYFCFFLIPIFPICRYRVISEGNRYRFLGKTSLRTRDRWHIAVFIGLIIGLIIWIAANQPSTPSSNPPDSSTGYRVPSSTSSLLAAEKAEIESEKLRVQALDNEVEDLGREIERQRAYLNLDPEADEVQVNVFNTKVRRYNVLLQEAQMAEAALSQRINDYNARVRAHNR